MARMAMLPLLALFLAAASYTSATTLEELCKGTKDAAYCVKLMKATVDKDTDFKSVGWRKAAISRATIRATMAKDEIAKHLQNTPVSKMDSVKLCGTKLESSVKSLKEAAVVYDGVVDVSKNLDSASADQQACSDALKGAVVQGVAGLRSLTDEAYKATGIVKDLIK